MHKIHRGHILHSVAKRHKKSIILISKEAGYDKSTFYFHKDQENLSFDILLKYGKVIDHDFSRDIPEMEEYLKDNGLLASNYKKLTYEELEVEKNHWKDKYYSLLEENSKLIKEKYK